jgi:uncharacterized protein
MQFYTTEQLGKTQKLTPEGFLVVEGAALARTGLQLYSEKEIPLKGDADGHIMVQRDPEEVFHPNMMASLHGKPITLDHPTENVTPDNWKSLAVGYVINPRRGTGMQDGLLLGDLIITDPKAIKQVRDGNLRELSVGYDSAYEQTGPGRGRQHKIIANHLAIIETGRCGPICRIGDSISWRDSMPKKRKPYHLHIHVS